MSTVLVRARLRDEKGPPGPALPPLRSSFYTSPSHQLPRRTLLLVRLGVLPFQIKVLRGRTLQSALGIGLVMREVPIGDAGTDDTECGHSDTEEDGPHIVARDGLIHAGRTRRTGIGRLGRLACVGKGTAGGGGRRPGSDRCNCSGRGRRRSGTLSRRGGERRACGRTASDTGDNSSDCGGHLMQTGLD